MRFRALDALIGHIFFERRHESWQIILDPRPHVRSISRSNPDSRDLSTGSVRPFRAIGVPIPSLEYYGRRRVRRFLALARVVFFVPELARVARCKATSVFAAGFVFLADILFLFAPWTVGVALGLRRQDLEYGEFQPSPARTERRHRCHQAPSPRLAPPLLAEDPVQRWRAIHFHPHRAAQKEAEAFHRAWRRHHRAPPQRACTCLPNPDSCRTA